jgi:hypothetical protein
MTDSFVRFSDGVNDVNIKAVDLGGGLYALANGIVAGAAAIGSLAAGEAHIGEIGGKAQISEMSVTMSTAGAYQANDFVGGNTVPITFPSCSRINAGYGGIIGAVLVDKALQSASLELWLFDDIPTAPNDNAAWTISDADAAKLVGVIPFSTYYASAANSVSIGAIPNGILPFKVAGAALKALYGCVVTRGTPTYASGDLVIRLLIVQN